jgi:hypothetical protein
VFCVLCIVSLCVSKKGKDERVGSREVQDTRSHLIYLVKIAGNNIHHETVEHLTFLNK